MIVESFCVAKVIPDEKKRGWAFGLLAPELSLEQLADALAEVSTFRDENNRIDTLTKVARHLPPQEKATVIREAFVAAQSIQDERGRSQALRSLAPHLSSEQAAEVCLAAKHFRDNGDRQLILESFASRLAPKDIPDAIEQAKEIGGELCHARVLASVAQHLSPEQLSEGVVAADELKEDLRALHIQVQRLSTGQQTLFVKSLAKLAAELPRDQALKAIASSRHIFVAVGGSKLMEDLCRAIIDTGRWYA